ncbi:MAG: right-handed parallel beta-helix repeat-containing protein [Deltaproteobacteria bacterium]|nr:right-handed parallel beta-helix repeat-containing protein [Deltaproteobacteria bacterium]
MRTKPRYLTLPFISLMLLFGCNGDPGPAGESVHNSPVSTGDPSCPYGGSELVAGGTTTYACNGAPGDSVTIASLAPSEDQNCPTGGSVFTTTGGQTSYACHGRQGPVGPQGASPYINVKSYGATGDGSTDDTEAIQAAVDSLAGSGGIVFVPTGTYMVQAVSNGISLGNHTTLWLTPGAMLKAIPNSSQSYAVVLVEDVTGVSIIGGTIAGERDEHTGVDGQWGMGISIRSATNVLIEDVTIRDCWGDGIYVGFGSSNISANVKIRGVLVDHNRRQGLSIVSCSGCTVEASTFSGNAGQAPQAGIDLEPNSDTGPVEDTRITGNLFVKNGYGLLLAAQNAPVERTTVTGNTFTDNFIDGIRLFLASGNTVSNNVIRRSGNHGIAIYGRLNEQTEEFAHDNIVANNIVEGSDEIGISLFYTIDNVVSGNLIVGSGQSETPEKNDNLALRFSARNSVQGNTMRLGSYSVQPRFGIFVTDTSTDNVVSNNDLYHAGATAAFMDQGVGTVVLGGNRQ